MAFRAYVEGACLILLVVVVSLMAVNGEESSRYDAKPYGYGPYGYGPYGYRPYGGGYRPYVYRRYKDRGYNRDKDNYVYRRFEQSCNALEWRFVKLTEQLRDNNCQSACGGVDGQQCQPESDSCSRVSGLCKRGEKCCSQTTQPPTPGVACPIGSAPPPGSPVGTFFAQCSQSGTCDDPQYPTLETGYKCPGSLSSTVCCLFSIKSTIPQRPCSLVSITTAAGRSTHCPGTLAFITAAAGWSTQRCPRTLALIFDIAAVS
ncbi:hypothetical protein ACOMHN_028914 [Nucella lapillus]